MGVLIISSYQEHKRSSYYEVTCNYNITAHMEAKHVLIIGGGFSGIGALKRLNEASNFEVTLLEASGKLGGRIKTVPFEQDGHVLLELGATFIHGEEGNSLYEIARELGVNMKFHKGKFSAQHVCFTSSGEQVDVDRLVFYGDIITDIFQEIAYCYEKKDWSFVFYPEKPNWSKPINMLMPQSVSDYVTQRFKSITSGESNNLSHFLDSILDYWLLREAVLNGTKYSSGVDMSTYSDFSFPLGHENIILSCGYDGLVEAITTEVSSRCLFNKRVCLIDWNPRSNRIGPLVVQCDDGSTYSADHVIVTVSLGVLQDGSSLVFDPPLPTSKRVAIDKIGMGLISKLVFTFPNSLTPDKNICKISFLWREEERSVLSLRYPWAAYFYSLNRIERTNSWIVWFAGEEACRVETLPDSELKEGISVAIELFLRRKIERPSIIRRINWGHHQFFKGSYSFNATGSSKVEREELSQPIDGATPLQLLFAGEATNPTNYSTTNGAYDTGVREANRLISFYAKHT